jgi:3-oxoacyl-[acyl-carrier protein] reductase
MKDPRVIIITGANGGLGRALAERFGQAGCRIIVHYHQNQKAATELTADLGRLGAEAMPFRADVRSLSEMNSMTEAALKRWNRLDVFIANAAIRKDALLLKTRDAAWDSTIGTNLTGVWNSLKAVGEHFIRQREGRFIAIGSVAGLQGRADQSNYAASKAGLTGLIRSAAMEWAPYNIQLNIVFPGLQPTGMTEALSIEQRRALNRDRLLDQAPPITEVAEFVHFLSRMNGVSGQIFNLDSRVV